MKTIKDLKERLIKEEGLRLKPYRCTSNKLTIGIGRNIEERGISEAEALYLLENDIEIVLDELYASLHWLAEINTTVRMILIDMAFNMGVPRLLAFKNTLKYIREGDYKKASVEMLDSRWAGQVPIRAKGLSDLMAEVES
jgi:lysozyme